MKSIEAFTPAGTYGADIDGLRAIAVTLVICFHASPQLVSGGFIGVDVFFIISGFLIGGNLFRAIHDDQYDLIDFYRRRILRIFPALLAGNLVNSGDVGHIEFQRHIRANFFPCTDPAVLRESMDFDGQKRCQQSKMGAPDTILLGDSHAKHLFVELAERFPDRKIAFYQRDSIPTLNNAQFNAAISSITGDSSVTHVIIAALWHARRLPADDIINLVRKLLEHNIHVAITNDTPNFPFCPTRCQYDRIFRKNKCAISLEFMQENNFPATMLI